MKNINLSYEQLAGGHSIAHHGAQLNMNDMKKRVLGTHQNLSQSWASSFFFTRQIHEDSVNAFFTQHQGQIEAHFQVSNRDFARNFPFQAPVGIGLKNVGTWDNPQIQSIPKTTTIVRIVFRADPNHPRGFFLLTAYPKI